MDTGWINDENPLEKAAKLAGDGFQVRKVPYYYSPSINPPHNSPYK